METAKKFTGHVRQSRVSAGQNVRQMWKNYFAAWTCTFYDYLSEKHGLMGMNSITEIMGGTDPGRLGKYLNEAFEIRQERLEHLTI